MANLLNLGKTVKKIFEAINPFKEQTVRLGNWDTPSTTKSNSPSKPMGQPKGPMSIDQTSTPGFHISVPSDQGMTELPPHIAQLLGNTFDQSGNATESARVLLHPNQLTNIGNEQARGINLDPNRGENPGFVTSNIDRKNPNGSTDRGLFRINSDTFKDYVKYHKSELRSAGINSYDDMEDPNKNAAMAKIIYGYQGWKGWYAAPQELRDRIMQIVQSQ